MLINRRLMVGRGWQLLGCCLQSRLKASAYRRRVLQLAVASRPARPPTTLRTADGGTGRSATEIPSVEFTASQHRSRDMQKCRPFDGPKHPKMKISAGICRHCLSLPLARKGTLT